MADTPKSYLLGRERDAELPVVCVCNATPVSGIGRTFLVFAPWCDQGLGVHARAYVHWLTQLGHAVLIFACTPSKTSGNSAPVRMQADPTEWAGVKVHYSEHSRETVPTDELLAVSSAHHVTDALMLETARKHIYQLSWALFHYLGVRVYAVPNIEMVQREELLPGGLLQRVPFHRILCSNAYTHATLKFFGTDPRKLAMFPFALPDTPGVPRTELHCSGDPVKFLLVGGMNAERRKRAGAVIAAFIDAFGHPMQWPAATLTVLTQGHDRIRLPNTQLPGNVEIIEGHLTHAEVLVHYAAHHVLVMVSRAEGVGIGFHEAMRAGCAIITLNTALFKEVVSPDINGWLVPAVIESAKTSDHAVGVHNTVVSTHTFNVHALAAAMRMAVSGSVAAKQIGSRKAYEQLFSNARIVEAYKAALSPTDI